MRTNFVQTCKTSANRINLNRITMRVALIGLFISLGIGNAWAGKNSNYYASLKISAEGPTGAGSVYVANSNSKPGTANPGTAVKSAATTSSGGNVTMYWWVDINPGYNVSLAGKVTGGPYSAASANGSVSCAASTSADGTKAYTATATFVAVTVNSVDAASKDLAPTNPSIDYPFTVTFATSNLKTIALDLNKSPETADGKFTITSWAQDGNNVVATGKFNGGGSYGGASRNNSTTVSLQSKASGSTAKTCTITANFPALAFVGVEATEVFATQGESGKTGSATFTYNYGADDDFPTTPTIVHTSGSGAFAVTGYTVTPNFSTGVTTVKVNYEFNTNNGVGETVEQLKLTAANGLEKTVTITGHSEALATDDVRVTEANGDLVDECDWATAISTYQAAGRTFTILRNIDLGTITATYNISKAITIDLNGKELRAAVNATSIGLLTITAAVPVTIKDSKTGGKIINEIARNSEIRTIFVNKAGATLTLESGMIAVNNLGQYASAANADLGVVAYASCAARAIHQIAGTTVNINGGRVEAYGTRSVFGIVQASSVATNKAGTTVLNITGGEIYAEAPYAAYGLQGYGKVNFSGGNINVKANTNMIDARYAADNANNKYNGLIYGILISAYANATAASCYYGTLNMTGGNINVTNERVGGYDRKSYGVLIDCANANMGANTAVDGSKCQKAAAKGSIDGGTITVNSGTYYSFGVYMSGSYNSYDNTSHVLTVKNCTVNVKAHTYAYGVFSQGAVNTTNGGCYHGDIELTNCTVTVETTVGAYSYAAFVTSRVATIYKNASTAAANYYHGEYGSAGKLTINSGTYKAYAKTTTAYCVSAGNEWIGEARARTVYADETNVALTQHLGGNVEAYPTLIIHGGDFYAETFGTTTARAVSSGGYTTIDGGTFKAVAKTNNAYGLVAVSGTMKATGVTVEAEGNASVYGVLVNAGISDYTLFDYFAEAELNNLDVTATTRTGTEARGVSVVATTKTQTEATKETLKTNGTKEGATSTQKNNYKNYYNIYQVGEKAVAGKVKINGGTYRATAATTTAYGVVVSTTSVSATGAAHASAEGTIKNATFVVKTNGTTSATGIYAGGPTTIEGCNITVQPKTTTAYGVYINDKKTTLSNTTINVTTANTADATKSAAAYGIYNNASISSIGWIFGGELEANEGNVVDVKTTSGTTAYGVYTHAVNKAITSEVYTTAGTYVAAARTTINGGKYTAHANNTTGYAVVVADPVLGTEVTGIPTCIINDGKFKGTATSTYADVSVNGEPGYFVLNGGYYVKDENLDKKLGEEMNKVAVKSGTPEYTEGYRWRVTDNMTGEYVCKIKEKNTSYASLEEALQVVNATPNSTWTIIMIANYTLSKGDYVLPANTTLLIPYQSDQTAINGANPKFTYPKDNVEIYEAPTPLYKLTFANGVNMSVYGKIEASAVTYLSNQGLLTHGTGVVSGKYGWLYLNEGSHIDLESGSALYAWGYVTGKGEINAKNGSAVYEDFQMGDWRGGTVESNFLDNKTGLDKKGVFVITHYYYQNIECPITYRAGAQGLAHGGTYMYYKTAGFVLANDPVPTTEAVKMIGTSGAMFLMDPATAGEDTWVRKEYDAETDYVNWTMNSGAKLGSVSIHMDLPMLGAFDVNSADYVLPITSNFNIVANYGEIDITNHVCFLPGSKLTIKKEGVVNIPSGQRVFFYDKDDWKSYGGYWFNPGYSPSWKVNPRVATIGDKTKVKMSDAEVLVEGLLNVNGAIYTTAGGANIHSTRENAGKVKFGAALPASTSAIATSVDNKGNTTTLFQITSAPDNKPSFEGKALNSAWLKNEDGTYSKPTSANTSAGDTWTYMQSLTEDTYEWTLASEDGCFTTRKTGDTKTYVHPSDWVAVGAVNANHAYPSEDATRMFVNTEAASTSASCKWWDVNPTPEVIDGTTYYVANNENFDNFGTYYYWDNSVSYWKPKKVTVTWNDKDGNKITNGTFGDEYDFNTSPVFHGTNPTWANSATEKHDWIGWRDAEGNIYDKNATLPRATSDVTYTAYFNTTKYQYTITFKNNDNSDLWAGLVDAGTTGAELQALFEQKYNEKTGYTVPQKAPTVDKVFTFTGWNTALATVTAAATYTAQYSESPRKYHVTFYNYDAVSVLYEADVNYNTAPTYSGVTPFRANTSAYSYNWTGWQQGATTYGTTAALPVVTGNISYIATFAQTELQYQVFFKRQDGTIIDAPKFSYEETPSAFPANPTMASTVSTDYTFREWSPATLVPVTEDGKVYTALFDESPRQYTAHFVNYDATSLNADQTIDYNTVPAYMGVTPMKPNDSRNSYEFSGWAWAAGDGWEAGSIAVGEAFPAIKGNITFKAQFNPVLLQFNVIYKREDGTIIEQQKKKWGETTAFPYPVASYEDETYTYTFDHWSPATVESPVTADATYTAYYNQSIKTYSITAVGISPAGYGSVSPASLSGIPGGSTVTVNGNKITVNGTTITATPTAATAQYTYDFDHWNNVPATVTSNVTNIEAVFTRTLNTYTVTWKNADGTPLETDEDVPYGTTPTYNGATPTKTATAEYTYTFTGWDNTPVAVTGDATYNATFSSTKNSYEITWLNDDNSLIDKTTVEYGVVPTHADATKANTAEYTYTFIGWDNTPVAVTGAATYKATFSSTKNSYEITWLNDDNSLIDKTTVEYGVVPTHADATKVNTAEYTYTFTGWDNTPVAVTGAATYKATFSAAKNSYEITWLNDDNSLIDKTTVEYGIVPTHAEATKANTASNCYTFAGWDSEIVAVTGAKTYKATFSASPTVAAVTAGGTTYYATLQAAFDYAAGKTTPTITVLKAVSSSPKLTYTNSSNTTVTFDLNGYKVAGGANPLLYITGNNSGKFIIKDGSVEKTGQLYNRLSTNAARACVHVYNCPTEFQSGTIYMENTSTSTSVAAYGVNVRSGRKFDMTGGTIKVVSKKSAQGIYTAGTTTISNGTIDVTETANGTAYGVHVVNGTTTINGNVEDPTYPKVSVTATKGPRGVIVGGIKPALNSAQTSVTQYNGKLYVNGGTYTVTASADGTTAYGVYAYRNTYALNYSDNATCPGNYVSAGTATITAGDFTVTASGADATAYGVCIQSATSIQTALKEDGTTKYAKKTATPKGSITGGKYIVSGATKGAVNTSSAVTAFTVQGGWYNIETGLATYTAPAVEGNYRVLDLPSSELPYKYEVAEAYTITFKDGDNNTIQEGPVKKGVTPSYTGSTPTKAEDESYTYSFTGWSPAITAVSATATYTAQFSSTPRTYAVTLHTDGGTINAGDVAEYTYGTGATLPTNVTKSGFTFGGWFDNSELTGDAVTTISTTATGDKQFWAKWELDETGDYLDIVGWTNSTVTLNANGWSAWPCEVNGNSYAKGNRNTDRTLTIPYSGAAGTNLLITVEAGGGVISKRNYPIPFINTIDGTTETSVVYINSGKLTIDGSKTLAAVYVAPGAELEITGSLTVGKLFLRTDNAQSAILTNTGTLTATNVYYTRITRSNATYDQFGLPLNCALSSVTMSNAGKLGGSEMPYGSAWSLLSYDEAERAEYGKKDDGSNWSLLASGGTIKGGAGYQMISTTKYYREYYFPVDFSELTNVVPVSYTEGAAGPDNRGWNIICSPLTSVYTVNNPDPATGMKLNWLEPTGDAYVQEPASTILPARPFAFQTTESCTELVFNNNHSLVLHAPRRVAAADNTETEWLHLDILDAESRGDQTSLYVHPSRFAEAYEAGVDVAKLSFSASHALLYSSHAYGEMAFAGVSDALLENGVALTVYSPKEQELTISMRDNEWLDRMAYVWLIDNETGAQIDLLESDYTFEAAAGTTTGRFILMGRFFAPQIATDIDEVDGEQAKPKKLIIRDKLYILINDQLYDGTGKMVK